MGTLLWPADQGEIITEGEDDSERRCWRHYALRVRANGVVELNLVTLAYSPPDDWGQIVRYAGR